MRVLAVIAAALLLAACSGDEPTRGAERPPDDATGVATPTPPPTPTTSPALGNDGTPPPATPGPMRPGAALVEWTADGPVASPIDATTARDMPVTTRPFLRSGIVSPDGRWLLTVAGLAIIEIEAWEVTQRIENAPPLGDLRWTADSAAILGWREHCPRRNADGECPESWREVWRIDRADGSTRPVATFDVATLARAIAPDGTRAYAVAEGDGGDAVLVAIDLVEGGPAREVALPGLSARQPGDGEIAGATFPALAVSPDGTRLYLVHPDDDLVTVVDTAALHVETTFAFAPEASPLERLGRGLLSELAATASASTHQAQQRAVALAADGAYLVIGGSASAADEAPELIVIDTRTHAVVLREPGVSAFLVTPDGQRLLAYRWHVDGIDGDDDGGGVRVLDIDSLDVAHHIAPGVAIESVAVSPDGRYAYVTSDGPGTAEWRRTGVPCDEECWLVSVVDLETGEAMAERMLDDGYAIVSLAAPP